MKRREVIALFGGVAVGWSHAALAQQPSKVARIGWMSRGNVTAIDPNFDAFREGLRDLGHVEGESFVIEPRYADGKSDLMPGQAAELERLGVDLIVAGPFEAVQAAKQSTKRVPIIMTVAADPVVTGLLANPTRPEGNITGITEMMPELTAESEAMRPPIPTESGHPFRSKAATDSEVMRPPC